LAGLIGHPLRKLARAAERIRASKGQDVTIPDMSHRRDEIGELSMALRDMTQALHDRMESIESFAADVSHELKNPLTSLRSAVETVSIVKSEEDRKKLLDIILHDVQRLDRLITDISKASRLDVELARDEMEEVDVRQLLENIVSGHKTPMERTGDHTDVHFPIKLDIPRNKDLVTMGNYGRLTQVFENLISNALSFSPEDGVVTIRAIPSKDQIIIEVEDEGPGIPESKLEDIFERFYSERPKTEEYGKHSGLGLSITKQIISAHGGDIYAENVKAGNQVTGACFTVILNAA
jgi:two-component system sensor histidine kinase ChvG